MGAFGSTCNEDGPTFGDKRAALMRRLHVLAQRDLHEDDRALVTYVEVLVRFATRWYQLEKYERVVSSMELEQEYVERMGREDADKKKRAREQGKGKGSKKA